MSKLELVRKHLLLSPADMAVIIGVSRVTYYNWVKGKPLRGKNKDKVQAALRKLLVLVTQKKWPTPETRALEPAMRQAQIVALMTELG